MRRITQPKRRLVCKVCKKGYYYSLAPVVMTGGGFKGKEIVGRLVKSNKRIINNNINHKQLRQWKRRRK